jgi:hypothetical protein
MDLWKLAIVAPDAAGLTLLVAGLAQWVRCVCDRWQEKLLVCGKLSVAGHVNLNVWQYCLTFWLRDAPTSLTLNNCTVCPHCIYVFCKQRLVPLTA